MHTQAEMLLCTYIIQILTVLGLIVSTASQCNTPLLRDIINTDSSKRTSFLNGLGTTNGRLVPLLNQSQALELRHRGNFETFSTPIFKLDGSTEYYITAIDIQFGNEGTTCQDTGEVINMETIRIGNNVDNPTANAVIQIGYANDNVMDLIELGINNAARIVRFKINSEKGRIISYAVSNTRLYISYV